MTDTARLLDILDAAATLAKATLAELRDAHTLCDPDTTTLLLEDDDIDLFLADLDRTTSRAAACEIIDLVGKIRTAQGWVTTDQGEQP